MPERIEINNRAEALQTIVGELQRGEENRQVRLAMLSAGVVLAKTQNEVEQLWTAIGEQQIDRDVVEPKLVELRSSAAIELWRERIARTDVKYSRLITAIEGLGAVGDESDREPLLKVVHGDASLLPVKLQASRALGAMLTVGLEPVAQELLDSNREQKQLLAANLLRRHPGESATQLMHEIVGGDNGAAQAVAYRHLAEHDTVEARSLARQMISHSNNNIRLIAIDLLNQVDDPESLRVQAEALSDRNINVRYTVRENLEQKATNPALREVIDELITFQLNDGVFEGMEQAIMLVEALGEEHRAERLVAHLDHPRPEIGVHAAWALKSFELQPEVLDEILQYCQQATERMRGGFYPQAEELRDSFLFEALGRHAYKPASDLMMEYVPKNGFGFMTRASAIYALGHIWQDRPNRKLTNELARRMLDESEVDPEHPTVKFNAMITMGRVGDASSLPHFRDAGDSIGFAPLARAHRWAVERIEEKNNISN